MKKAMKILAWAVVFILPLIGWAQAPQPQAMPPYYINNLSVNATNGIELYQSETIISTGNENEPVSITGTAKVDYKASKEVELKPGFTASDFTGDGEFHAYIDELPFEVAWFEPTATVGTVPKYEKLELGIKLPQEIQDNITNFLNDPTYPYLPSGNQINPYDPEQISVEIHLTSPDNRNITKYGFYYKEFEVIDPNDTRPIQHKILHYWNELNNDYTFRIRIAPDYVGAWAYTIKIILNETTETGTYYGKFECVPSDNKGFLEVSTTNNKYLRFDDAHESFFAIGENIAKPFVFRQLGDHGTPFYGNGEVMLTPRIEGILSGLMTELSDYGGNYMRLMMSGWALSIERERLGVYDVGNNPHHTGIPYYGQINRQHHALEIDKILNFAHEKDIYIQLCLEGNSISPDISNEPVEWGYTWIENPYLEVLGQNAVVDDFFSEASAKEYYKRKLRYITSRWGYSTNIAVWEFFNEVDLLFYPPGSGSGPDEEQVQYLEAWHNEMADHIRNELGDKHLIGSSFGAYGPYHYYEYGGFGPYDFDSLDVVSRHQYSYDRDLVIGRVAPFVKDETDFSGKPMIIGEMDLYYYWALGNCSPLSFHNANWASAFTGSIGTYMHWEHLTTHDPVLQYYKDFLPLANFMQGVDHEWNNWQPHTNAIGMSGNAIETEIENVEHFYMTNFNGTQAMGWFHNRSAYWANELPDCYVPQYDENGIEIDPIECPPDDPYCLEYILPLSEQVIYFDNLNPGTELKLQFFDTHSATAEPIDYPTTIFVLYDGYVYFDTPQLTADRPDYAYKLWPHSEASFRNTLQPYLRDTAVCAGEYFTPYHLLHNFTDSNITVNWLFSGTGTMSEYVAYLPGSYSIKAILNNHGSIDTLAAKIFIKDCQPKPVTTSSYDPHTQYWLNAQKNANPQMVSALLPEEQKTAALFKVYPVPTRNTVTIEGSGEETNWTYELHNITGALTLQGISYSNKKELDVSRFAKGIYLLKINSQKSGTTGYKIIVD